MNNKFVIIGILVIVFLTASLSFGFAHGIKNENKGINGMAKMQNADVWNKGDMIGHNSAHMGMDNMDNMGNSKNCHAGKNMEGMHNRMVGYRMAR